MGKALLKVSESSPEQDKEEDSELDSNDENVEDDPEDLEEDKLDLEQLKKMNAFELISKATKSTILSEKLKKPSQAAKDDESDRIRRKLKERLRAKTPVLEERGEQDSLRSKLLMKMRQQEERSKEEKPQSTKKKKIASKKIVEPKPSAIQSTNEEWTSKDRFEKVRKRLRNESSDDDSEEEKKKSKGNQFE